MSRPRQYTDEAILEATRSCILAHGPAISTTVIAEQVGMSQGALFKRFGTKNNLIIQALSRPGGAPPFIEAVAAGPGPDPIRDQLRHLGTHIIGLMRNIVPCMAMLHASGIHPRDLLDHENSPPVLARKAFTRWFEMAQEQGRVRPLDPSAAAVAFLGMLHARPFREIIIGDTGLTCSDAEYVTHVVDLVWAGMKPEAS